MTFAQLVDAELIRFRITHLSQKAGTRNALLGSQLENIILISNQTYEARGWGVVKKNNVEMRQAGGKIFHAGKQTVDFDGYLKDIGFVAFDAKSTSEAYWRPAREQIHQFLFLYRGQREMSRLQARFFYLLEHRVHPQVAWFLVEDLESIKRTGRYDFRDCDRLSAGTGMIIDYRQRLVETKHPPLSA